MEHQFICSQELGDSFSGIYYVERFQIRLTTQSKEFTDMILRDRSGSRPVKHWNKLDGISKGDFVFVAADVVEYMGYPSVVAKNVSREDSAPENVENYIPVCDDLDTHLEGFDSLRGRLDKVKDQTPSLLVGEVYKSSRFFERFCSSPGSDRPHYGRHGGLVINIVRTTNAACSLAAAAGFDDDEMSVLIAAGLVCRVGGIDAFDFHDCLPVVTARGTLLGVATLTMTRVTAALRRVLSEKPEDVDQDILLRILHAVNSHDGVATQPMTREAIILHEAWKSDCLISESFEFMDTNRNGSDGFTAWDRHCSKRYYVGDVEE